MLQIAAKWIQEEQKENEAVKKAYMAESCPSPNKSGDQAALMVRHTSGHIRFATHHENNELSPEPKQIQTSGKPFPNVREGL